MPMISLNWETAHLHGETWISHHRLRNKLFVKQQGWDVPNYKGMEYDQFDTPAAMYLLWIDERGQARAVTRLLPTDRPFMIQELWPESLGALGKIDPRKDWEATRFGVDRDLPPVTRQRALGELIAGCLEYGLQNGIEHYLCFMPKAILQGILGRAGCDVRLMGDPVRSDNHDVFAARINISHKSLRLVRQRRGIDGPVLMKNKVVSEAA